MVLSTPMRRVLIAAQESAIPYPRADPSPKSTRA
jgi:hypothetical protein